MPLRTAVLMCASITALAQPKDDILRIDPLLIAQAEEVWKVIAAPDNPLWPGWDASTTPILFYLPGVQDVLINHPDPPNGFKVYTGPVQFADATIHIRHGVTHFDADGQNTSTDVNGVRTLVVADTLSNRKANIIGLLHDPRPPAAKAETLSYDSLRANPYDQMAMIAHEAFHVYQDLFSEGKHADERTVAQYPTLSVENNVGFALEAAWLAAALKVSSPEEARDAALNWLAVRTHRRAMIAPEAVAYEDGNEFAEGLAKSTEFRLLDVLEGRTPSDTLYYAHGFRGYADLQPERDALLAEMSAMMRGEVNVNNDPYGAAPMRMRLYYSGMAIAAMLDRLMPGDEWGWRERIFEPGTTLTSIAESALVADADELTRRWDSIAVTDEYHALTENKEVLREEGEQHIRRMVEAISHGGGTLLVIDYSELEDIEPRLGFTPFGVQRVDEHRAIYHMTPISGRLRETVFRQTTPSPLLHDRESKLIMCRLPREEVKSLKTMFGWDVAPSDGSEIGKVELEGISLDLGRAMCSLRGDTLTVTLQR